MHANLCSVEKYFMQNLFLLSEYIHYDLDKRIKTPILIFTIYTVIFPIYQQKLKGIQIINNETQIENIHFRKILSLDTKIKALKIQAFY